jgi:hypothetical protein
MITTTTAEEHNVLDKHLALTRTQGEALEVVTLEQLPSCA